MVSAEDNRRMTGGAVIGTPPWLTPDIEDCGLDCSMSCRPSACSRRMLTESVSCHFSVSNMISCPCSLWPPRLAIYGEAGRPLYVTSRLFLLLLIIIILLFSYFNQESWKPLGTALTNFHSKSFGGWNRTSLSQISKVPSWAGARVKNGPKIPRT